MNIFKKNVTSDIAEQQKKLGELQGTSAAYIGSIESMVKDLEEVATQIDVERAKTSAMMEELAQVDVDLANLKYGNNALVNALKAVFNKTK